MDNFNLKVVMPIVVFESRKMTCIFMDYYNNKKFINNDVAHLVCDGSCLDVLDTKVELEGCFTAHDLCDIEQDFAKYLESIDIDSFKETPKKRMTKYAISNIIWATNGEKIDSLPNDLVVVADDIQDLCKKLADEYGYLIDKFTIDSQNIC